jgi:hypothetical protein
MGNNLLYDLVLSLTQNEKRYFKLMAAQQGGDDPSQSVKLFDAISKQGVYDETILKKKFKRFAALKLYLYDFILKSLTQYNHQSFEAIRIRKLLDEGEVLQRKGLYAQAIKRLEKAEKMAEESGASFVLHDILRLKLSCLSMIGAFPASYEEMNAMLAKLSEEMVKMNQTNFIFTKSISLVHWSMHLKGKVGNEVKLNDIIDASFIDLEKDLCGRFNKHYYYRTLKMYYDELGDTKKWKESSLQHIEVFEEDVAFQNRLPSNYFHALSTLLSFYAQEKCEKEAEKIMTKAIAFLNNKNSLYTNKINDLAHISCTYFNLLLQSNDSVKIKEQQSSLMQQYVEGKNAINVYARQWMKHLIAMSFMLEKNWKEALKWNNELINYEKFGASHFLFFEGYLQNILVHYRLGNNDYVERLCQSVHKIVAREQVLSKDEKTLLQSFQKLSRDQFKENDFEHMLNAAKALTHKNSFIYNYVEEWIIEEVKVKPIISTFRA